MPNYKDITGQKFGKLTALEYAGSSEKGNAIWKCKCDCGNYAFVEGVSLRCGNTRSCGCLHTEILARIDRTKISHKKHGAFIRQTQIEKLYTVWKGMKRRCYRESDASYRYYGGRGITICDEWKSDYAAFRGWAMSNGYDPNAQRGECTIDRIDNDGNYEPGNCRFVSMAVQNKNRRRRRTG